VSKESAVAELWLELASQTSLGPLLRTAVGGLARSGAALARIWLRDPEAGSDTLRLAASAGRSRVQRGEDWARLDGAFRSHRVGSGKIGAAAERAEPVAVRDVQRAKSGIARPDWARREGIRGFAALPLESGGNVLGVLGVFRREPLDDVGLEMLREVAAHVAAGIRRGLDFGELELRAEALAGENRSLRESLAAARARGTRGGGAAARSGVRTDAAFRELERENLRCALERSGGRIYGPGGAAEFLGIPPTTLASRIRSLGVQRIRPHDG
jgi:GAF domain-containing protein